MTDPKLEAVRVSRFDFVSIPGGAAMMPGTAYVWAKDYDTLERRLHEAQRELASTQLAIADWHCESEGCVIPEKASERAEQYRKSYHEMKAERDEALRELAAERESKK